MNKFSKNFIFFVCAYCAATAALFFIMVMLQFSGRTLSTVGEKKSRDIAGKDTKDIRSFIEFDGVKVFAEVADTPNSRAQGLSGRAGLSKNEGMLFLFDHPEIPSFWMKGMLFPIDIIWIRNGKVIYVSAYATPEPESALKNLKLYSPREESDSALEVAGGFAREHGITTGALLHMVVRGKEWNVPLINMSEKNVPGSEFFIETLMQRERNGSDFNIEKTLGKTDAYEKFLISYISDGMKISGVMNVPNDTAPKKGFPLLILNHGLIGKDIYFPGRGSRREQDFFARHGYVTVHPDYRGLGESDPDFSPHHDFYVGYSLDVAHLVDAVKKRDFKFIDDQKMGMWGHSMGGGIATRVMLLRPEIRAFVLFAPISADAEDNFYELTNEEIMWLYQTYGREGAGIYRKISPLAYFQNVTSPVQLHHGTADKDVPISFSEKMYAVLKEHGKRVEYFVYAGAPHEFVEDWSLAAERALQFFDRYVKN